MSWIKAFSLGAVLVEARRRKDVSRLQRRIAVQDAEARARAAAMMNEAPSPSGEGEGSRSQERSIEREMEVEAMRVKHDAEIRDMALKNESQMAELVRIHSTAVAVMERSMDVLRMENQELKERHSKLAFRWKQQLADVLSAHMDGRLQLDKDVMTMLADLDADIMGTAGPSDAAAGYVTPVPSPARAQSSVVELGGMYSGVEHGPRLALAQPDMVKRLLQVGVEAAAAAKLAAPGTFPSIKTPGRPRALQSLKLDRNVAPAAAEPTAPPVQQLPAVKPQPARAAVAAQVDVKVGAGGDGLVFSLSSSSAGGRRAGAGGGGKVSLAGGSLPGTRVGGKENDAEGTRLIATPMGRAARISWDEGKTLAHIR